MNKQGKIDIYFLARISGGLIGGLGFFLSFTYNPKWGTFLLGLGTVIASFGLTK